MESIAVDGAKSAINIVLSKAWDEIHLMWGFRSDLNKLKKRLKMMEALLVRLGERQLQIKDVELKWFDEVKKAAYEADDLLDEILYEHLRRKQEIKERYYKKDRLRARYFFFMCMSNPLGFQWRMAHKVREVMALIDEVFNEASKYGIQPINVGKAASNDGGSLRPLSALDPELQQCRELPDARQFIGRKSDEAKLVEALCSSFSPWEDLPFVAIVGSGGIGKTTLAKRIYENEAIKNKFSKRIWICISDDFDIKKILGQMIEQLTESKPDLTSNVAHINKLRGLMDGAKYLLVLDDVWNEKEELWQSLKGCLHSIGGSNGSVVLITCRNRAVADSVKSSVVRTLEGLDTEDSRALFEQTVFANEGKCPSGLEVSAGKIINKCKGVPLAIRTLGAALRSNEDPRHWESIANSELWNTQQFQEIAPYLLISFRHLPSIHVQQCFAYCSIYPKDYLIPKDVTICLWMAQGLLCPEERSTSKMEEIGENYFNILLNHSFLQVDEVDEYGGIRGCKMHDLVHDLARFVSKRDWLICGKGVGLDRGAHISHLVVGSDMTVEVSTSSFMEIMSTRLRTVRSFVELPSARLMQSRYVRVLILSRIGLKEVPNVVGELKHLRYFDVGGNPIKELPESITTLYHLQTLILYGCSQVDKLPKGLSRLVNLRHVFANYWVEMPTGIERLACLQTLPPIRLSASGGTSGLSELGCLPDVKGSVRVSGLEHVKSKEEAQKAGFGRKTGISNLQLHWSSLESVEGSGVIEEEVLDGLQPHPNIRSLVVDGFSGDSFPSWLRRMTVVSVNNGPSTSLDNIVFLKFQDCRRCEQMPALGKLPHLETLLIEQMKAVKHIGTEFYTYDDGNDVQPCSSTSRLFPALKTLEITECPELKAWQPPEDPSQVAFPCLEELKIIDCPFLTITPTDFPSLRGLELKQIRSAQPLHNILNTNGNNNHSRSTLTSLIVDEIQELTNLPQGLSHRLTSLETLKIWNCFELDCLPEDLGRLISLKTLTIFGCTKLKTFPEIGGLCSLIELVIVYCGELEEIPSGLDRCTSLQKLWIYGCLNMGLKRRLEEENRRGGGEVTDYWTGEWLGRLPHLQEYGLGGNGTGLREEEQPDRFVPDITPLLALRSLRRLVLVGWPKLKSLPDQLERFTLLDELAILGFDGMEEIPEFIGGLSSLCRLYINYCSNLKSFPSRGTMLKLKQLNSLDIWRCPLLTEGCRKDDGPEWHKISHIKYIKIDGEVIQDLV